MPIRQMGRVALLALVLTGCALPPLEGRHVSVTLPPAEARATPLGDALAPQKAAHPGKTGVYLLSDPVMTFAALTHLARTAQRSLDLQYYIWYADRSGTLLLRELLDAADRGVRVRLLLDDQGTRQLDAELAALHDHPNIAVRLFNPFMTRDARWIGFLTDFNRANRRMHNKVLIADNQALISGGRNIGDSYFGSTDGFLFSDLDILAVGPVVDEVSRGFDRYWQSRSAYPADRILPTPEDEAAAETRETLDFKADAIALDPQAEDLMVAVRENYVVDQLLNGQLGLEWAPTRLVIDPPTKGLGEHDPNELLTLSLREQLRSPEQSLDIISSFFVPTPTLTDDLISLARQGVRVRVLTNSLDATDMAPAHTGYARYRRPLLEAGVELFEMRRVAEEEPRPEGAGPFGSPATTLHAKAVVVDDRQVFIGSYNVDPRSVLLNTELGFVIDSPDLARAISHTFEMHVPTSAYRLKLEHGEIRWLEQTDDGVTTHPNEPGAGPLKRAVTWFFSLMPIEWML
ncbi:phospholipase D family protein [Guyparkeria halophila]|uniref:Phospholipase D family protein n=1 Tax=Guyparkeria halophila TaxID=47960 RepID=A0ABZ0Z161_9GAMM|nr:phospholipase D family protein [Guyparkeria halophila]WQH17284.1 phospholipase D family protein [Guyparkeria halophila]